MDTGLTIIGIGTLCAVLCLVLLVLASYRNKQNIMLAFLVMAILCAGATWGYIVFLF